MYSYLMCIALCTVKDVDLHESMVLQCGEMVLGRLRGRDQGTDAVVA